MVTVTGKGDPLLVLEELLLLLLLLEEELLLLLEEELSVYQKSSRVPSARGGLVGAGLPAWSATLMPWQDGHERISPGAKPSRTGPARWRRLWRRPPT
jgi:hypothetical protein